MASRTDEILGALVERLALPEDLDPIPAGLEDLVVDRFPLRPGKGTRIRVYPFDGKVVAVTRLVARHELVVKLALLRLPILDGLSADQAVDPLYVWAIQRLLGDPTLGGRLSNPITQRGYAWGADEKEEANAMMVLEIGLAFQTRADNPELRA